MATVTHDQFLAMLLSPEFVRIAPYVALPRLHAYSHYTCQQHVGGSSGIFATDGEGVERPFPVCPQRGELVQYDKLLFWGDVRTELSALTDDDNDDEMPGLMSQDESDCEKTGRVRGFKAPPIAGLADLLFPYYFTSQSPPKPSLGPFRPPDTFYIWTHPVNGIM
ncbi:hypothetical protein B0H11DRAFT_2223332 [Mycena galericulata]|nr:hypothetical protein B0H11DRAFT_2223332 [Mycena galericulata]